MIETELLLRLLSFAAEAMPGMLTAVHTLVSAFAQKEGIDLGKEPPDGHEFADVDRKVDAELAKKHGFGSG